MESWVLGPVGMDAEHRVTRTGCRTVLVMVPTVTAGHRLLDLISLLESDYRIQTVFSIPQTWDRWQGPDEFVTAHCGLVFPWQQAIKTNFDLVLTASHREIDKVHGNVLVLPHGAGSTMSRVYSRKAAGATAPTTGLDRELLTYRGRVVPAAIALTHHDELTVIRERCPEAAPRTVVAGDICLDRMMASKPERRDYRNRLGVGDDQMLVTVSSTWSPASAFGQHPNLCRTLLDEGRSQRCRVAVVLHPNVWAVHGQRQVRAWFADCANDGLLLIPPDEGWRAAVLAADWVIGDHGSTTLYACAAGTPVSLAAFPDHQVRVASLAAELARAVPRIDHDRPLLPQRQAAVATQPHSGKALSELMTSEPGRTAGILRRTMYRLLDLSEPSDPAPLTPVPPAVPLPSSITTREGGRR